MWTSLWISRGALSKKMAQDLDGIEDAGRLSRQLRQVQTGGPDGTWTINKQVAQAV